MRLRRDAGGRHCCYAGVDPTLRHPALPGDPLPSSCLRRRTCASSRGRGPERSPGGERAAAFLVPSQRAFFARGPNTVTMSNDGAAFRRLSEKSGSRLFRSSPAICRRRICTRPVETCESVNVSSRNTRDSHARAPRLGRVRAHAHRSRCVAKCVCRELELVGNKPILVEFTK